MNDHPLAEWRRQRGISRFQLAATLGVSTETVSAIERGLRSPSRVLQRLVATKMVTMEEAEQLKNASALWLEARRQRAREEVLAQWFQK